MVAKGGTFIEDYYRFWMTSFFGGEGALGGLEVGF
jgi:hypothetical protein